MTSTVCTRGPKVTVKKKPEPCVSCGKNIRRGVYSPTLKWWVCVNPVACVGRAARKLAEKKLAEKKAA